MWISQEMGKGSTLKDNSPNTCGPLEKQVPKPRMLEALRCEAHYWREEPGRKYEMCTERNAAGKKQLHSKLQP